MKDVIVTENYRAGQSAAASEIAALREDNARLREALTFYADRSAWNQPPVETVDGPLTVQYRNKASEMQKDRGKIARTALGGTHDAG